MEAGACAFAASAHRKRHVVHSTVNKAEMVILISGVPGSGKTTVSRRLAERLPLAAHIEGDAVQNLIVSGGLHPDQEPKAEAQRQLDLKTRNVALLADSFFEAGVTPVIDDTVVKMTRLNEYVVCIRSRPLVFVMLAPPLDVSLARDTSRSEKHVGHIWRHLDEIMRRELSDRGLWLDTSDLTPDETVDLVLQSLSAGVLSD